MFIKMKYVQNAQKMTPFFGTGFFINLSTKVIHGEKAQKSGICKLYTDLSTLSTISTCF